MHIIIYCKGVANDVFYDDSDHDLLSKYKWHISRFFRVTTAIRVGVRYKSVAMHRMILGLQDPTQFVDHKDHNPRNNSRENLRLCTHQENMRNKQPSGGSDYLGVCIQSRKNENKNPRIVSQIVANGRVKYLGTFKSEIEAAQAYDEAAKIHHGEFANLNFK